MAQENMQIALKSLDLSWNPRSLTHLSVLQYLRKPRFLHLKVGPTVHTSHTVEIRGDSACQVHSVQ